MKYNRTRCGVCLVACGLVLAGCGSRVETQIKQLGGNADDRKVALIELAMTKSQNIPAMTHAAQDATRPLAQRVDLITVLFRILLREGNPDISQAFRTLVDDPAPEIRQAVVRTLGDLQQADWIPVLLKALADPSSAVQSEALVGLAKVENKIEDKDVPALMTAARAICDQTRTNAPQADLYAKAEEAVEGGAEKLAQAAEKQALGGQIREAEATLRQVLEWVPASKNITYKLARFYYDNDQKDKGLALLEKQNMLLRIKKFAAAPTLDGDFSDPCWEAAMRITNFYQCLQIMTAKPIVGKTEIRVGYTDEALYIAYKAYEASPRGIKAATKTRDGNVWSDDCIEIFIDPEHDYKTFCQICVNSLGTTFDTRANEKGQGWNVKIETCPKVFPEFWAVEVKIPMQDLETAPVVPGAIWGFNLGTVRIGNSSEYGQWAPTYGNSRRPECFGFLLFE